MASTDVIFRIGTLGISKTSAELGMVVAGLVAVGKVIAENVKKADSFSNAWKTLSSEQKSAVMAMDTATKGFIASMDNMTAVGKMAVAGMKPTNAEMANLATVAAVTAKNLGEGPEGAKRRLDQLTESLINGNERGLKPYGITLESNGTLAEKQAEVMAKISEKAKGLSLELDGLDDKFTALGNSFDKTAALAYDSTESWGALGYVLDALGVVVDKVRGKYDEWNALMVASNGHIADHVSMGESLANVLIRNAYYVGETTTKLWGMNDAYAALIKSHHAYTVETLLGMGFGGNNKAPSTEFLIGESSEYGDQGSNEMGTWTPDKGFTGESLETWMPDYVAPAPSSPEVKGPKGGGGKKKKNLEDVLGSANPYEYANKEYQDLLNIAGSAAEMTDLLGSLDAERVQSVNDILAGMSGISAEMQAQADMTTRQIELETESAEERMARLQEMMGSDPTMLTTEEKYEVWDAEYEHRITMQSVEQEHLEYLAKRGDLEARAALAAQESAKHGIKYQILHAGALAATTRAAQGLFSAMWDGSLSSAAAMRKMIAEVMQGMSIEYGVKAVAEAAEAVMAIARDDYLAAAKHGAAAGEAAAVAAAATVAAMTLGRGGSGASSRRHSASGGGFGGGGGADYAGASQGYSGGESSGPTEIVINVDGTLAPLFGALNVEAKKQKKSGAYSGGF